MRRDNLYRAFKGELMPAFDKVVKVLIALDIQLVAKPFARRRDRDLNGPS
jgi:DNA-binding phage protein